MVEDLEIQAMIDVKEALEDLEPEVRLRVLRWVADRFDVAGAVPAGGKGIVGSSPDQSEEEDEEDTGDGGYEFEDFAALYSAASPETEAEKVLVGGYWFQVHEGHSELTSRTINDALKDLGHQVGNMTREFGRLMSKKPQLAVQVKKTGSSKQARKIYRLTSAGKRRVKEMLGSE